MTGRRRHNVTNPTPHDRQLSLDRAQSRTSTKSTNLLLRKFDLQQAPELQEMHSLAQQTLICRCGCLQWTFVQVLMLWRKECLACQLTLGSDSAPDLCMSLVSRGKYSRSISSLGTFIPTTCTTRLGFSAAALSATCLQFRSPCRLPTNRCKNMVR